MAQRSDARLKRLRHPRYVLFLGVLVAGSLALQAMLPPTMALLCAFDMAVTVFVLSCAPLWLRGRPDSMRAQAQRDDAGQGTLLLLTALICAVVMATLAMLVLGQHRPGGAGVAMLVATLLASWAFANLIYAFHYARLYYTASGGQDHGGLDFPGDAQPDFADFVNFAFVIGMTCQTADIAMTHTRMRRIATFQGLFAFVFNLGILALTVNVLASAG